MLQERDLSELSERNKIQSLMRCVRADFRIWIFSLDPALRKQEADVEAHLRRYFGRYSTKKAHFRYPPSFFVTHLTDGSLIFFNEIHLELPCLLLNQDSFLDEFSLIIPFCVIRPPAMMLAVFLHIRCWEHIYCLSGQL